MIVTPSGGTAVMARRETPKDALDDFPTPPWATRALIEHIILPRFGCGRSVWEPAAGKGIMASVLGEYFEPSRVHASDIHDYGAGFQIGPFVTPGKADTALSYPFGRPDWIITNPPFKFATQFAIRAIVEARVGVALLVRLAFLEGLERYESIVSWRPYSLVCPFVERVPMVKGRWDPKASTATAYAWFVWDQLAPHGGRIMLCPIPPGRREALTRETDIERFAG